MMFTDMSQFAVEGLADNLAQEVKPLGIRVHIIEPGFFRTSFLKQQSQGQLIGTQIEGYEAGHGLRHYHDQQNGDPKKGVLRIYEVVTGTGLGKGKEWNLRIMLGSDTNALVEGRINEMTKALAESKEIALSTDLDA